MKKQRNRLEKCVKITLEKSAGACDRDSADHLVLYGGGAGERVLDESGGEVRAFAFLQSLRNAEGKKRLFHIHAYQ